MRAFVFKIMGLYFIGDTEICFEVFISEEFFKKKNNR